MLAWRTTDLAGLKCTCSVNNNYSVQLRFGFPSGTQIVLSVGKACSNEHVPSTTLPSVPALSPFSPSITSASVKGGLHRMQCSSALQRSQACGCHENRHDFRRRQQGELSEYSHAFLWGSYAMGSMQQNGVQVKMISNDFTHPGRDCLWEKPFVDLHFQMWMEIA